MPTVPGHARGAVLPAVEAALRRRGHLHGEGRPEPLDHLEVGPVAEPEDVGAVVGDVDQHVVGPRDDGVEQHPVAVAALAAGADVDPLLHQRLAAAQRQGVQQAAPAVVAAVLVQQAAREGQHAR